jgi:hypothetical protein
VVVHRLLAAAIGIAPLPDSVRDKDALHDCAGNLNMRHRNAQMAGRASVELHTLIFFKDNSVVADARVVKVRVHHACSLVSCKQLGCCRYVVAAVAAATLHACMLASVLRADSSCRAACL